MLRNISNPPSLIELARQVGINECTLKRGFRQIFGNTMFGYLHDYRMEQARQLLSLIFLMPNCVTRMAIRLRIALIVIKNMRLFFNKLEKDLINCNNDNYSFILRL